MTYHRLMGLGGATASCNYKCGCADHVDHPQGLSAASQGSLAPGQPKVCLDATQFKASTIAKCNLSTAPMNCAMAKDMGTNFLGRGDTGTDVVKWVLWEPMGAPSSALNQDANPPDVPPPPPPAAGMSDGLFYGLLAAGALVVLGGVYYATKH